MYYFTFTVRQKYADLKAKAKTGVRPVVLVNACTHGHEKVGELVLKDLQSITVKKGTLLTNLANERAYKEDIPFSETDLNRCFPGKEDGAYEERLAHYIHSVVTEADVVIDIHSTKAWAPGAESALIVTKLDPETLEMIKVVNPPKVFIMKYTASNALISDAKIGIGFEYGREIDEETRTSTTRDIKRVLGLLGMIEQEGVPEVGWQKYETEFYEVYDVVKKEVGEVLEPRVKNFTLVKAGDHIATTSAGTRILAASDFYPVLFGENRYEDIFGFMGKRMLGV